MNKDERQAIIARFTEEDCKAFYALAQEGKIKPDGWVRDQVNRRRQALRKGA